MRYMQIRPTDISNGPGIRVSLFVSGCKLNCKNCFNKEAQNFKTGQEFTQETIDKILNLMDNPQITGISILGGDPLEPENQKEVLNLIKQIKTRFNDNKDIWIWTGRIWSQLLPSGRFNTKYTVDILKNTDIVIDGPFIQDLYKKGLIYMGSTNQKIIDSKKSINSNKLILSEYDFIEKR